MTRLRKTSITCPCCDEKFSSDIMFSTIWSGKVSTDLLRFSMGTRVPVNYLVHTCPECGWSGQEEHPEPAPPEIRRFVRENITPDMKNREIPPWRKWEYHAHIKQAAGCGEMELGSVFLIAAQCARLGENYEEEKRYRLKSIDHYLKAVEKGEIPEDSLYQTTYILGELYRRVGNKWKSNEWYQKVLEMDQEHERRDFFVNLARQQMSAPRDYIDEEDEREAAKQDKPGLLSRLKKLLGIKQVRY
jgi:uncharacterized protein (DUF2225 family)